MGPMKSLRVGVIGVGYLGTHHARIYRALKGVELVGLCDTDLLKVRLARKFRTAFYPDHRSLFGQVDCVSIVVPTQGHFQIAKDFLEQGIHVLIEKPMTETLEEADALLKLAREHGLLIQVGHVERFNKAVETMDAIFHSPRFIECHRLGPFRKRGTEVGVVLDLMIHDIDIVLYLVKSPVERIDAVGVNVLTPFTDIANVRINFKNGAVANLTASRITRDFMRKIRIFGDNAYVSLDYMKQRANLYRKENSAIRHQKITIPKEEPLRRELEAFASSVQKKEKPLVSGEDGREALRVALEVERMIQERLTLARQTLSPIPHS